MVMLQRPCFSKFHGSYHQKGGEGEDKLPTCFDEDKLNNDMIKEGKRKYVEDLISFARYA